MKPNKYLWRIVISIKFKLKSDNLFLSFSLSARTMVQILWPIWIPFGSIQIPFGLSQYWIEFSICDNLKNQKRCSEALFFLECIQLHKRDVKLSYPSIQQSFSTSHLSEFEVILLFFNYPICTMIFHLDIAYYYNNLATLQHQTA